MIYLDNAATTKPKNCVVKAINECLTEDWGNPSSLYRLGIRAKDIVMDSRKTVADLIGAKTNEIIFTSGACEANSLAICGFLKYNDYGFITTTIEHKSIMNLYDDLQEMKTKVLVDSQGFVDTNRLEELLATSDKKCLISIQYANNEIGTIQNIEEIADLVHKYSGILHTDATQIIPDRKINVKNIDMLSFSGQKLGATKGIGILYIKNGIDIKPIIYGSQERSLRGGTENVPYIAGLKAAIDDLYYEDGEIRDYFIGKILKEVPNCYLVGTDRTDRRLNNNVSICFKGVESESLLLMLDQKNIYVSSGSACNSASLKPSYVLEEIGLPSGEINSVVRFTFCDNTKSQIDIAVREVASAVKMLRSFN